MQIQLIILYEFLESFIPSICVARTFNSKQLSRLQNPWMLSSMRGLQMQGTESARILSKSSEISRVRFSVEGKLHPLCRPPDIESLNYGNILSLASALSLVFIRSCLTDSSFHKRISFTKHKEGMNY